MIRIAKRPIILLEVFISLGLMMILLSTLLFFYKQITTLNTQLEGVQRESFEMRYLENRFANVIPKAMKKISGNGKKPYFYFFTSRDPGAMFKGGSPSLVLTYDNCVNYEKPFSGRVIGRFFVDDKGTLTLGTWPSPRYWPSGLPPPFIREILLENVDSIDFEFFLAPQKKWKELEEKPKPKEPSKIPDQYFGTWVKEWPMEYQQLPEIVRITITYTRNGASETRRFEFPIPNAPRPIIYDK